MGEQTTVLPRGLNQEDLAIQIDMLRAGEFHFDHMPRPATWRAAGALIDAGLVESWETGSDEAQYTALNFRVTDRGREALRSMKDKREEPDHG